MASSAVVEDEQGRFVFVVGAPDADGTAGIARRSVRVGELTAGGIEVLEGLEEGDRVVTAGVSFVREGMKVRAN